MLADSRQAQYGILLALFLAELRALKWVGVQVKRARQHKRLAWEKDLRQVIERRTRPYQGYLEAVSNINQALPVVDVGLWCFLRVTKRRDAARFWGLALGGATMLRHFTKAWVHRQRPAWWERMRPNHTTSFPSGHATDTLAVWLALLCLTWRTAWRSLIVIIGTPAILLIGIARIALEKHYPTDILAGWMTSAVWVLGVRATHRRQRRV